MEGDDEGFVSCCTEPKTWEEEERGKIGLAGLPFLLHSEKGLSAFAWGTSQRSHFNSCLACYYRYPMFTDLQLLVTYTTSVLVQELVVE